MTYSAKVTVIVNNLSGDVLGDKNGLKMLFALLVCFVTFSSTAQTKQNQLGFIVSAPWVNNYRFYDYHRQAKADKGGFMGLGAGGFYKNDNNKLVLNSSVSFDFMLPFGEPEYA